MVAALKSSEFYFSFGGKSSLFRYCKHRLKWYNASGSKAKALLSNLIFTSEPVVIAGPAEVKELECSGDAKALLGAEFFFFGLCLVVGCKNRQLEKFYPLAPAASFRRDGRRLKAHSAACHPFKFYR